MAARESQPMLLFTESGLRRVLLALPLIVAPACSTGLGGFEAGDPDPPEPNPNPQRAELGLGFDPGVALSEPIDESMATLGIRVPGPDPAEGEERVDRDIVLVAFSSAAPADDADGDAGLVTPLVQDDVAPVDDNGVSDVFLAAIEDQLFETQLDGLQPVAFDRALLNVFRHTRCVTCHAVGHAAPAGELTGFPYESGFEHPGDNVPGGDPSITSEDEVACATCHNQAQVADIGALNVEWRAPLPITAMDLGIPFEFDFRGKSVEELNARAQAIDADLHMRVDSRVRWAIESGRVPDLGSDDPSGILASSSQGWLDSGRELEVGAVPIDYGTFLAQVEAWEQGGFQATGADSVRDLVLVSESQAGAAANGVSNAPTLAFVPNGAFTQGGAEAFGTVFIAYVSRATDLTADASPVDGNGNPIADVFVSSFDLFVTDGDVDLVARNDTSLVSAAAGGGGANAASRQPQFDESGNLLVFASRATDFGGFTDGNGGGNDIFLADLENDTITPLSLQDGSPNVGGNGGSRRPAISPDGEFVAFESSATDLVGDDANGEVDIFLVEVGDGSLERVSVTSEGDEASGGDCRNPSLVATEEDGPIVVFDSAKTDLTSDALVASRNVFVRLGATTDLLSQERVGNSAVPGNGDSHSARIGPAGDCVVYVTEADNLDFFLRDDENGFADILLADLGQFLVNGDIKSRRLTLSALREDAGAASRAPLVTAFRGDDNEAEDGFVLYRSDADNLGSSGNTDLVGVFLNNEAVLQVTDFSANPDRTVLGETVAFENLSTDIEAASFSWDFGDGTTSNLRDPEHVYLEADRFEVSLSVTRGEGDEVMTSNVMRFVEVLEHPGAAFSATPEEGFSPLSVAFAHQPSSNDGLDEADFVWTVEGQEPVADDATFDFDFENEGDTDLLFDVTLDVTLLGVTQSSSTTIEVQPTVNAAFNLQRSGEAPLTVTLEDLTAQTVLSRQWSVTRAGDAGFLLQSTDATFTPTLTVPDTYSVELCVTVEGGQEFCATQDVDALAVSWADIYTNVFSDGFWADNCSSCHSGVAPDGNLTLSLANPEATRLALVGVASQGGSCPGETRVVAGDPDASLLIDILDPAIVECNTAAGMPDLDDAAALERVKNWILHGANP